MTEKKSLTIKPRTFAIYLTLTLLCLKAVGIVHIDWVDCFFPLLAWLILFICLLAFAGGLGLLVHWATTKDGNRRK